MLRVRGIPFGQHEGGSLLLTLDDVTRQEALENTRQRFISNLSHELRTPLTSLRIAVENLQAEQTQSGLADPNVAMLLRSLDRMTLLLEDISELSRIESGALRLNPASVLAKASLGELMDEFRPQAVASGIGLTAASSLPEDARIRVDALRLHQLVGNLLSNAIKFSPAGSRVELRLTASAGRMRWEVSDQGPGIAPGDQAKVFERFFRAATVRGIPGTGLGLAIAKHLARLMDGEVGFTSAPGQGTTFWVELPLGEG
jgi:signal transduction histidine kinase